MDTSVYLNTDAGRLLSLMTGWWTEFMHMRSNLQATCINLENFIKALDEFDCDDMTRGYIGVIKNELAVSNPMSTQTPSNSIAHIINVAHSVLTLVLLKPPCDISLAAPECEYRDALEDTELYKFYSLKEEN